MSQFILATETGDEAERDARMAEILRYNEEDLAATWAVFEWLRGKGTGDGTWNPKGAHTQGIPALGANQR